MPHFRGRFVNDALRLLDDAPVHISRMGPIHFISPIGDIEEVYSKVRGAARQFLIGADAIIFGDGMIVPVRFVAPTASSAFKVEPRRTSKAKLILFVEGKDIYFLDRFAQVLGYPRIGSMEQIELYEMGGGDAAHTAVTTMKNANKGRSRPDRPKGYAIRDRDYKSPANHDEFAFTLARADIEVHVWERKEIENYLVVPRLLARSVEEALTTDTLTGQRRIPLTSPPTASVVEAAIMEGTEHLKHELLSQIVYHETLAARGDNRLPQRLEKVLRDTENAWNAPEGRFSLLSGDVLLATFRNWARRNYRVTITNPLILKCLQESDVCPEIRTVLTEIMSLVGQSRP